MSTTEPTAVEQLLALELAREVRRQRRNRALAWAAAGLAVALVVYFAAVRPAQERAERERRTELSMFCDMTYGYGTDLYEVCVKG